MGQNGERSSWMRHVRRRLLIYAAPVVAFACILSILPPGCTGNAFHTVILPLVFTSLILAGSLTLATARAPVLAPEWRDAELQAAQQRDSWA